MTLDMLLKNLSVEKNLIKYLNFADINISVGARIEKFSEKFVKMTEKYQL